MIKKRSKISKNLEIITNKIMGKKFKRIPFFFEVHIIDSCNLNCSGCDHFAPLAKKDSVYPIENFKKDINRMADLFSKIATQIHIMGGEPLTNRNINEYLRIVRDAFPKIDIQIITNATLLTSMPEDFYQCCIETNSRICVSTYPINLDYEYIYKFVKDKGVNIETFNVRSVSNVWKNMGLSRQDLLPYKKTFLECKYANNCANLREGKLYFCPHAAYIGIFNDYFKECYNQEFTGIDIYTHNSKEILDFIRTPNKFCEYCHINDKNNKRTTWSLTKKRKEEWTKNY